MKMIFLQSLIFQTCLHKLASVVCFFDILEVGHDISGPSTPQLHILVGVRKPLFKGKTRRQRHLPGPVVLGPAGCGVETRGLRSPRPAGSESAGSNSEFAHSTLARLFGSSQD